MPGPSRLEELIFTWPARRGRLAELVFAGCARRGQAHEAGPRRSGCRGRWELVLVGPVAAFGVEDGFGAGGRGGRGGGVGRVAGCGGGWGGRGGGFRGGGP